MIWKIRWVLFKFKYKDHVCDVLSCCTFFIVVETSNFPLMVFKYFFLATWYGMNDSSNIGNATSWLVYGPPLLSACYISHSLLVDLLSLVFVHVLPLQNATLASILWFSIVLESLPSLSTILAFAIKNIEDFLDCCIFIYPCFIPLLH